MSSSRSCRKFLKQLLIFSVTAPLSAGNVSQKEKDKRLKQPGYLHLLAREMFTSPPEQVTITIFTITIVINTIAIIIIVINTIAIITSATITIAIITIAINMITLWSSSA